jgi:hypothetical protein
MRSQILFRHLSFLTFKIRDNVPRLCKLHKDCLTGMGHGAMVNKTPPFLHFPVAKSGTKSIANLPIAEGLSFRSLCRRIYGGKLRNDKKIFNPSVAVNFPLDI